MTVLCEPIEFDGDDPTALYRLYDAANVLIYVGITSRPATRMRRHAKTQPWWGEVVRKTMVWYPNRVEACGAETATIYAEKPRHNKLQQWSANLPQRTTGTDCDLQQPMIIHGATRVRLGGGRFIPNTTGIWGPTWSG